MLWLWSFIFWLLWQNKLVHQLSVRQNYFMFTLQGSLVGKRSRIKVNTTKFLLCDTVTKLRWLKYTSPLRNKTTQFLANNFLAHKRVSLCCCFLSDETDIVEKEKGGSVSCQHLLTCKEIGKSTKIGNFFFSFFFLKFPLRNSSLVWHCGSR